MATLHIADWVDEGTDFDIVAAIAVAVSGEEEEQLIVTSDVSGTITLAIYEQGSTTAVYSANLTTSAVLFNTPQLDAFWQMDAVGYNFRTRIRQADVGAGILKGGRRYTCQVAIPTTLNGTLKVIGRVKIESLHA